MSDTVGAVVIGRNEGQRLIRCLSSLAGRVSPIVYVDSGSTDGSLDIARRTPGVRVLALEDVMWTLLNSSEFLFNH